MKKKNDDLLFVAEDGESYLVEVNTPKERFSRLKEMEEGKEKKVERKEE